MEIKCSYFPLTILAKSPRHAYSLVVCNVHKTICGYMHLMLPASSGISVTPSEMMHGGSSGSWHNIGNCKNCSWTLTVEELEK